MHACGCGVRIGVFRRQQYIIVFPQDRHQITINRLQLGRRTANNILLLLPIVDNDEEHRQKQCRHNEQNSDDYGNVYYLVMIYDSGGCGGWITLITG